jgi:hypothetical protein
VGEGDCQDRTAIDELLSNYVQAKIQTLQRPNSEQGEVGFFSEHDVVGGGGAPYMYYRVADVAVDASAVRDAETLSSLHLDVERFKYRAGNPGKLATGVDQGIRQLADLAALRYVLDSDDRT